jgi:2,3-dihydroxybenzoate-AMP ligase/mycobactin salicyl-AMP ligase
VALKGFVSYKKEDAEQYNKFRWWPGITFGDMLDKAAEVHPDKEALVDIEDRLTYSQLRHKANKLAISLMGLGIKPQERILLQVPNWNEFIYAFFAIQKIGAIDVLLLARHAQVEVDHICRLTGATAWIVAEKYGKIDYLPIIDHVLKNNPTLKYVILVRSKNNPRFLGLEKLIDDSELSESNLQSLAGRRPDPMDVAHMGPTGGTTGLPKVSARTHNDYICRSEYTARAWELTSDDTCIIVAPAAHDLSFCNAICSTLFMFGKLIMLDSTEPEDVLAMIQEERVTSVAWVPALADRLVNFERLKDFDVSSLRKMMCGGQAVTPELIKDVNEKLGCKVINGYGGTEGHQVFTRLHDDQSLIHTHVGRPTCPYTTYKFIDENGKELPINTPGELVVKGPDIFAGYYNSPENNKGAFTKDGFFKTGDQAKIDEAGNITITGRIKDMIKRGGENISPVEIEELMIAHPDIAQVSVIGMPDPVLSERICAYVEPKPGAKLSFEEIITFLKNNGASVLQLPERIEFMERLPLTKANKPDKKPLREDIKKKLLVEA